MTKSIKYSKPIVKRGDSHYVLVPKDVMRELNIKPKDRVYIDLQKVQF